MIEKNIFERVARRIGNCEEAMIQMQIALTAIPALSPENGGNGGYEKAKCLHSIEKNEQHKQNTNDMRGINTKFVPMVEFICFLNTIKPA